MSWRIYWPGIPQLVIRLEIAKNSNTQHSSTRETPIIKHKTLRALLLLLLWSLDNSILLGVLFGNRFYQRFYRLRQRLPLVRRMKIEINPAQWARRVILTQNDGDMLVQSYTVSKLRPAAFVSLDRLVQQRNQRGFKFFRDFVDANDIPVIGTHRFQEFRSERFDGHKKIIATVSPKVK